MALPGALLALPIVILIAATVLLIAGLRGRRVDDHPLCRRCGFDLIGLQSAAFVERYYESAWLNHAEVHGGDAPLGQPR